MRAVNLLPRDASQRKSFRKEDPAVVVGSALGVIVVIALVAGFLNVHAKVNAEQAKLTAARSELAQLSLHKRVLKPRKPVKVVPIVPVPAVTGEQAPRLAAVASALSTRIAWDRILREFSLVLPDDVTLSSLTMAAPAAQSATTGAPAGAAAQGIVIAGYAYSHDGVARLLSRLALIPDLTNVTLTSSTVQGTSSSVQFNISAAVKGATATPAAATPAASTTTPPATTTTAGATS